MIFKDFTFRNISVRNFTIKSVVILEHPHGGLICSFSTANSDSFSTKSISEIYLSRLKPESNKWDDPVSCMKFENADIFSYMMFLDLTGSLQIVYCLGNDIWRKKSYDYGKNWNFPEKIYGDSSGWKFSLRPVFSKHGRIIIPVYNNLTGRSFAFISDDGKNWFVSTYIEIPEDIQKDEIIDPKSDISAKYPIFIPEVEDSIVVFLQTENLKHIHRANAEHHGEIWHETEITAIPSNSSAIDGIRLRNSDGNYTMEILLVLTEKNKQGNSLKIAVTNDFGKSWLDITSIESEIKENVDLPCISQTPDLKIHLVYVLNGRKIKHAEFKLKK